MQERSKARQAYPYPEKKLTDRSFCAEESHFSPRTFSVRWRQKFSAAALRVIVERELILAIRHDREMTGRGLIGFLFAGGRIAKGILCFINTVYPCKQLSRDQRNPVRN
jgi:hypothetical protein